MDVAADLGGDLAAGLRSGADRDDLFAALLRQVDEPGTLTVLVVEDVHWADEATLDLLRFLGRRIRGASVLVVVTYRDDALPPDDPLRVALGELSTQRSTRRVDVPRLSREAVQALAEGSGHRPGPAVRPHRRQPVLRRRGAAHRCGGAADVGARRRARQGGRAR